jgi:hypothetical protein
VRRCRLNRRWRSQERRTLAASLTCVVDQADTPCGSRVVQEVAESRTAASATGTSVRNGVNQFICERFGQRRASSDSCTNAIVG